MNTADIKSQIHTLIDGINDSTTLNAVYALLAKIYNKPKKADFWDELPAEVKEAVNRSLAQVDAGDLVAHQDVMSRFN